MSGNFVKAAASFGANSAAGVANLTGQSVSASSKNQTKKSTASVGWVLAPTYSITYCFSLQFAFRQPEMMTE